MAWNGLARGRDGVRRSPRRGRPQIESLEGRQLLAVFTVNSAADSGAGSLRDAIEQANAAAGTDTINFSIGIVGSVQTIDLASELPPINESLSIEGLTQGGPSYTGIPLIVLNGLGAGAGADGLTITAGNSTVRGLVINRFSGNGIVLNTAGGNRIEGNFIGVNQAGTAAAANGVDGIFIDNVPNNTIGGTTTAARNVISGNTGNGILVAGLGATTNLIQNNAIGTNLAGTADLGNGGDGVRINAASDTSVGGTGAGQPNTIAFNGGSGVKVLSGNGNSIRRNSIFLNDVLGIDIDAGANDNLPAPQLFITSTVGSLTRVQGQLTGAKPNTSYLIEFFSNTNLGPAPGTVQGRSFVGSTTVTTDSTGLATINATTTTAVALNQFVSATATESTTGNNNSSEFSNPTLNVGTTNLVMTGVDAPDPVARNGYLTYTYTINNGGAIPANATFSTTLPSTLSFVQATSTVGNVSRTGNTVTVALGQFNPAAQATVTITVVPTTVGSVTTVATVTAPEDPDSSNNSVSLTTDVQAGIDLLVQPNATPNPVMVGDELDYSFTVTNQGETPSTATTLYGRLPDNADFVTVSTTQGTILANPQPGTFGVDLGNLAVNATAVVRVIVRPRTIGTVFASAIASGTQPEVNPSNNVAFFGAQVIADTPVVPDLPAPTVTLLSRFGAHNQPSSVLLAFSQPLSETTAEDLGNYALTAAGRDGRFGTDDDRRIGIESSDYDAINRTVVLTTRNPFSLNEPVRLVVNGTAPSGVANISGVLLAGNRSGESGTNFVRVFRGYGPGRLKVAQAARNLARAPRRG